MRNIASGKAWNGGEPGDACCGTWPAQIKAPTGAGKTAVEEIHVFLNAFADSYDEQDSEESYGIPASVPRRLCLTVNRRALVDSQYLHAQKIADMLNESLEYFEDKPDDILTQVAKGLLRRQGITSFDANVMPLRVDSMHGGTSELGLDRSWRSHPEAPMIICSTPDMFGSRLLFRGYGLSRGARPVEAGLLAYDTVLVVDEAHLNRQLVMTARQVARIDGLARSPLATELPACPLQVVESTATPAEPPASGSVFAIDDEDLRADQDILAQRLRHQKHISVVSSDVSRKQYVDEMIGRCLWLSDERGGVVGVIVNTVSLALEVGLKLKEQCDGAPVECVIGRMRPFDREAVVNRLLELAGPAGCGGRGARGFIVGTQALEVGIDYSCHSMVTELAPASAIVQRLGRVDRFVGDDSEASEVIVFDRKKPEGPYSAEDLAQCRIWLQGLPNGCLSAEGISRDGVPAAQSRRKVFQRLECGDAEWLSHTSESLAAEEGLQSWVLKSAGSGAASTDAMWRPEYVQADLDLWLRDEFDDDSKDIGVVVRDGLPKNDQLAADVLSRIPPVAEEVFPCAIGKMRAIAKEERFSDLRVFVTSDGVSFLPGMPLIEASVRPGDLLVFDTSEANFFQGLNGGDYDEKSDEKDGENEIRPISSTMIVSSEDSKTVRTHSVYDCTVLKALSDGGQSGSISLPFSLREVLQLVFHGVNDKKVEMGIDSAFAELWEGLSEGPASSDSDDIGENQDRLRSELFADFKNALEKIGPIDASLLARLPKSEVLSETYEDGGAVRTAVYVVCQPSLEDEDDIGREVSHSGTPITLQDHSDAVKIAVGTLSMILGLRGDFRCLLEEAAELHDQGKRDSRFQNMLGKTSSSATLLAKGELGLSRGDIRRAYSRLGLTGWRHEQYSAAIAQASLGSDENSNLVVRLVGTSHGHGRDMFAAPGSTLTPDKVDDNIRRTMQRLFDDGAWESIISQTNEGLGYWRVSYLEALLRAADARVSAGEISWNSKE